MTKLQVQTFLKKIQGILTYNQKSRIEQFIKGKCPGTEEDPF